MLDTDDLARFHRVIVEPTKTAWVPGWDRLSDQQQVTELQAALLTHLLAQDSYERGRWQAWGLYVLRMEAALREWMSP